MATAIIFIALIMIIAFSIRSYAKKLASGCCGGGDAEKARPVADTDLSHYPYKIVIVIGGMTCGRCASRVENALNETDGVWATVNLRAGQALVRCKQRPDMEALRRAVVRSGYRVESMVE